MSITNQQEMKWKNIYDAMFIELLFGNDSNNEICCIRKIFSGNIFKTLHQLIKCIVIPHLLKKCFVVEIFLAAINRSLHQQKIAWSC